MCAMNGCIAEYRDGAYKSMLCLEVAGSRLVRMIMTAV
jgi:hypothetical protein